MYIEYTIDWTLQGLVIFTLATHPIYITDGLYLPTLALINFPTPSFPVEFMSENNNIPLVGVK